MARRRKYVPEGEKVPLALTLAQRDLILDHTMAGPDLTGALTVAEIKNSRIIVRYSPETGQTLERLLREGYVCDEAMKLIGCALTNEIFGIMKNSEPFDNVRYVANLNRLPELPWEDDTQGRR